MMIGQLPEWLGMNGLTNRSLQCFLRDSYGSATWTAVAREARLGFDGFEAMLTYEPELTDAVIDAAARVLDRSRHSLMEDLGTYLVSHPNLEALRRLLRFGGVSFIDFLDSLEDLPARVRLALPELVLPEFVLLDRGDGTFTLTCTATLDGIGHVLVGLLRAMADDYGALVLLDHQGVEGNLERVSIHLLDHAYAAGRQFELATGLA